LDGDVDVKPGVWWVTLLEQHLTDLLGAVKLADFLLLKEVGRFIDVAKKRARRILCYERTVLTQHHIDQVANGDGILDCFKELFASAVVEPFFHSWMVEMEADQIYRKWAGRTGVHNHYVLAKAEIYDWQSTVEHFHDLYSEPSWYAGAVMGRSVFAMSNAVRRDLPTSHPNRMESHGMRLLVPTSCNVLKLASHRNG
jgi:hypothetical protein